MKSSSAVGLSTIRKADIYKSAQVNRYVFEMLFDWNEWDGVEVTDRSPSSRKGRPGRNLLGFIYLNSS